LYSKRDYDTGIKKTDGRTPLHKDAPMTKAKGNPLVATAKNSVYIMKTEKDDKRGWLSVIKSRPELREKRPGSIAHK
jgi:hypothetical protein